MKCQICARNIPDDLSRVNLDYTRELIQGYIYATITPDEAAATYPWGRTFWTVSVNPKHGPTLYLKFDDADVAYLRQAGIPIFNDVEHQQPWTYRIRVEVNHLHTIEMTRPIGFEVVNERLMVRKKDEPW